MKKVFLFVLAFAMIYRTLSCSCGSYESDFYKNVSSKTLNGIAVFDSLNYSFTFGELQSQTAYFILLDTINSIGSKIGDTIVITGQDGFNCGEVLTGFNRGDTIVFALGKGFYYHFQRDTFYLEGACGKHYLKIQNKQNNGLTINEIKEKIKSIVLSSNDLHNEKQILVFPNPTNGFIKIVAQSDKILSLKIIDITGRIIYRKDESFDYLEIDLSEFESGLYNINIRTNKHQINSKIIRN